MLEYVRVYNPADFELNLSYLYFCPMVFLVSKSAKHLGIARPLERVKIEQSLSLNAHFLS